MLADVATPVTRSAKFVIGAIKALVRLAVGTSGARKAT